MSLSPVGVDAKAPGKGVAQARRVADQVIIVTD